MNRVHVSGRITVDHGIGKGKLGQVFLFFPPPGLQAGSTPTRTFDFEQTPSRDYIVRDNGNEIITLHFETIHDMELGADDSRLAHLDNIRREIVGKIIRGIRVALLPGEFSVGPSVLTHATQHDVLNTNMAA